MIPTNIELLAPAGSFEALKAAVYAGADAVYLGGPAFGARAYAANFTIEELVQAIRFAHIHDCRIYLTVNTLVKNKELETELYDLLKPLYLENLDAVIVQDFGVFHFIKNNFPGLHLHASTQMTVTGPKGMKFLEEMGASRVVAARELSLSELSQMHSESPIEIEAFIHGALCYSFSGQCLMSSILGGRSGNRGRCAQPCRLPYQTGERHGRCKGKKDLCPLSLKDICTLDLLPRIIEAGVTSLKIEGRMKQPAYTAGVTAMYRKYLDLYKNDPEHYSVSEADRRFLIDIFNRGGSCEGYFHRHNGPSMMAFSNEKKSSVQPDLPAPSKRKLQGNLVLTPGCPAVLTARTRDICVSVQYGTVQKAKEHPMEENRIRRQMEKLGSTEFAWDSLDIRMDGDVFIPVSELNELRRRLTTELEHEICRSDRSMTASEPLFSNTPDSRMTNPEISVSCETGEQLEALMQVDDINTYYVNYNLMDELLADIQTDQKKAFLMLPHIWRTSVPDDLEARCKDWISKGMSGFLVRNLEGLGWLREHGLADHVILDSSMYTWNNEAIAFWEEQKISAFTAPVELNEKELAHRYNNKSEMLIYGYLPMMISAQCVRKNMIGCDGKEKYMILKDRYDKEFPSICVCDPWKAGNTEKSTNCYNILYNSLPFGLLKEHEKVKKLGMQSLRLSFTIESAIETEAVAREFCDVYLHGKEPQNRTYTKGHFKRGAE